MKPSIQKPQTIVIHGVGVSDNIIFALRFFRENHTMGDGINATIDNLIAQVAAGTGAQPNLQALTIHAAKSLTYLASSQTERPIPKRVFWPSALAACQAVVDAMKPQVAA